MTFNISGTDCLFDVTPVFFIIKEIIFGIDKNNNWVKITSVGKENFDNYNYDSSLLTLLEIDYFDFNKLIIESLEKKNILPSVVNPFPLYLVILNGLRSELGYWIDLAFHWINSDYRLVNEEISITLHDIASNKKHTQKIRHAAMKILRKINMAT